MQNMHLQNDHFGFDFTITYFDPSEGYIVAKVSFVKTRLIEKTVDTNWGMSFEETDELHGWLIRAICSLKSFDAFEVYGNKDATSITIEGFRDDDLHELDFADCIVESFKCLKSTIIFFLNHEEDYEESEDDSYEEEDDYYIYDEEDEDSDYEEDDDDYSYDGEEDEDSDYEDSYFDYSTYDDFDDFDGNIDNFV